MLNDLEKVFGEVSNIGRAIGKVVKQSTYNEFDDLSGLQIDYDNAEQLFLLDELRGILEKLDTANDRIAYLNKPIIYEGTLHKNSSGKYETENGDYYTSGNTIEAFIYDDYREKERWAKTSVESDGIEYYLVHYKDISMQGLKVRIRG